MSLTKIKKNIDAMAEAMKDPRFKKYSKKANKLIETKRKKNWVAYYLPHISEDKEYDRCFKTKKMAEKYIISHLCSVCKKEKDPFYSACGSEWLIITYKDFLKSKNHEDLMKAAGWKKIKK